MKGSRVYAIVWCLFRAVPLMRFGTLMDVMDVTAAEDSPIPVTALSHLGGGQSEHSEWLPQVSQWAGLGALPIRAHWCTVTFFVKDRNLYMYPVYTWRTSLETAPVTGSLLFVAPGYCLSDLSAGEIVLCVSRVSANLFLCLVCAECLGLFFGIIIRLRWRWGATARQPAGPVVDFNVQLQMSWNALEAYANLDCSRPACPAAGGGCDKSVART